jgi:hypothetical protein
MLKDIIAAIKEAMREWKRRAWLRNRRANLQTPFD